MILVTGANGSVGREVLAAVRRSGEKVRATYRSKHDAAKVPAGIEAAIADFADKVSLAEALRGIDSVFLVCSPVPDLVNLEINTVEACEAAGVKRIVLNSALGAADYPKSFPSWHRKVEDRLRKTKMTYCIVRPNSFMQNIPAFYAASIRESGVFYAGIGEAKMSFIDVHDIAEVVAKALQGGEHDGKTYELNGPEALSYSDVAAKITRQTGVAAKYVPIPAEAQRKVMLDRGMPEWQVTALIDLGEYYVRGQGGDVDDVLARLLGRAPVTMDEFLKKCAGEFRGHAAAKG